MPHADVEEKLDDLRRAYALRGSYVIRYHDSFGYGNGVDTVLLLPTLDQLEVVRAVGTNGTNYDISNRRIVEWLERLQIAHPFVITEAGFDYVVGEFVEQVGYDLPLARQVYRFAPDIVEQGTGTVEALAQEIDNENSLVLWWD